ncbi:MAG: hypothetical protein FJW14_18760 [Acidimicrobiia bacterium]|nr:hypothetical protein [Acidimicrobiia bacterium]
MTHELSDTLALLARTPAVLDALLRDLPDRWTRQTEGDGTWSAVDVVGHLAYAERTNWMPRLRHRPLARLSRRAPAHGPQRAVAGRRAAS